SSPIANGPSPCPLPDATPRSQPTNRDEGSTMTRLTPPGFSILVTLTLLHPAGAADILSTRALADRLAARPTGENAAELAQDSRTGCVRGRSGQGNVYEGAGVKPRGFGRLGSSQPRWCSGPPAAKRSRSRLRRLTSPSAPFSAED